MNENEAARANEVFTLKRRIKALGFTIGDICEYCNIHPTTFSNWAAGKGRNAYKWDSVCEFVSGEEKRDAYHEAARKSST